MIDCEFFGTDARFHHVGLAVRSISDVSPASDIQIEEAQKVLIAFVNMHGVTVELLEPLGLESPIARSLSMGTKLLHLCYEVADLEEAIELCRGAGFHRLGAPVPTQVFDNRRIVWVFSREYGLFELLERDRPSAPGPRSKT